MTPTKSLLLRKPLLAALLFVVGPALFAQQNMRYPEPTPPLPVPAVKPGQSVWKMQPMDAEVETSIQAVDARRRFQVTGAGLTVAVIDGGINHYHRDFQSKIVASVNLSEEAGAGLTDVTDFVGHGSNVASIIAGRRASFLGGGINTGVAHDANLAIVKVFPGGKFEKINEGLRWVLENHARMGISAVNMSLGNGFNHAAVPSQLEEVAQTQVSLIAQLRAKNIAVVVAAGNSYYPYGSQQGMSFPAIVPQTISVGAIYDTDLKSSSSDPLRVYKDGATVNFAVSNRCTAFTQRLGGSTESRTDIFAPGFFVTAAGRVERDPLGKLDSSASRTSQSLQDGTSQAAPVTCGVVLLLQERFRKLTTELGGDPQSLPPIDLIERCLRQGGIEIDDSEDDIAAKMDNVTGSGQRFVRLSAVKALEAMDNVFRTDTALINADLFRAADADARRAVLDRATILTKPLE